MMVGMACRRGAAGLRLGLTIVLLVLLGSSISCCGGMTYYVGGGAGWNLGVSSWPKGKRFKVGDVLVFKYNYYEHAVARVNSAAYKSCLPNQDAMIYNSGNDAVVLHRGFNYLIFTVPDHCTAGMKIKVKAKAN